MTISFGIITPVYKHWDLIGGLIYSLKTQVYDNWKLYIYNDEPGANAKIYTEDERIQIFNDNQNLGQVKRYNQGIRDSAETHLIFMGADDFFYDRRVLLRLSKWAYDNKWIISNYATMSEQTILDHHYDHHSVPGLKYLGWKNCICHSGTVIERETIKKYMYNERLKWAEDWELWLVMRKDIDVCYLPFYSVVRREYTSQTRVKGKTKLDHLKNRIARILIKRKFRVKW